MTTTPTPSISPAVGNAPHVVVVGGGLAGIAAAVRLARHGVRVTLVESRLRLGGRATSFTDPATGQTLDNCQHVLLGCCTHLLDLYHHLGVGDLVEWHKRLYFAFPGGGIDTLEADDLPAPLHLSRSLLSFAGLTLAEKFAISRGMLAAMRLSAADRRALNAISFAQWLADQGQSQNVIDKFWGPIVVSAINELPDRMGADYALQVFQEGMLAHERAYVMGLAAVPLVKLYDPAEALLAQAGGTLMLSTSAHGFHVDAARRRVTALAIDQERVLEADAFVSAVPFDRLDKLLPPQAQALDARLADGRLAQLDVSPIIGIHLMVERSDGQPVMTLPHLVVTGTMIQWLFNKGPVRDEPGMSAHTQHLHAVISAAHAEVDWPAQRILDQAWAELRQLFPAARDAKLVHGRVIKEKRATFSARPGLEAIRPSAAPSPEVNPPEAKQSLSNLYLAGDWCATGWPATMEGAVRSGNLAAQALLTQLHIPVEPLPDDLPPAPLYRMIKRG